MARISLISDPPSAVTMISASSKVGNAISMSAPRMTIVSTRPPRNPATMPRGTPTAKPKTTEARPTSSDTRAPQMIRLRRSRPNSSVPSQWPSTAPGPLRTAWENCADGLRGAMSGAAAAMTIIATASSAPMPMGSHRRSCGPSRPRAAPRDTGMGRSAGSARRTMAMGALHSA